jgi:hypothetical protein
MNAETKSLAEVYPGNHSRKRVYNSLDKEEVSLKLEKKQCIIFTHLRCKFKKLSTIKILSNLYYNQLRFNAIVSQSSA